MATLTLEETAEELTYRSPEGAVVTIRKVDGFLDVRQVTPISVSKMSWQELQEHLVDRVEI